MTARTNLVRSRFFYGIVYGCVLFFARSVYAQGASYGNQPDPNRPPINACENDCFPLDDTCSSDAQCCDPNQCNSSGECEPEVGKGGACENSHDCASGLVCNFNTCEPSTCDCVNNTCASGMGSTSSYICSSNSHTCVTVLQPGDSDACQQCDSCAGLKAEGMSADITAYCDSGCPSECQTDDDCPGGLVCINGQCGCSDACDDPSCPGYDDLTCNCPSNGCYSESCSNFDYCTCYPSDPSCQTTSCDPYDTNVCDPSSCYYDPVSCGIDCGCEGFCGDLRAVDPPSGDTPTQIDADPNVVTPQQKTVAPIRVYPMCDGRPTVKDPHAADPGANYSAAYGTPEHSTKWRIG